MTVILPRTGIALRVVGHHVFLSVDGKEKALTREDAVTLGHALEALAADTRRKEGE